MESKDLVPMLKVVDYGVFGHEVTNQSYVNIAVERRGVEPFYIRAFRILSIIKVSKPFYIFPNFI